MPAEKLDLQVVDDRLRDFILNGEDILNFPVIALRPQMVAVLDSDELHGDAQTIAGLANAPLDDVMHAKLLADLTDVVGPGPKLK